MARYRKKGHRSQKMTVPLALAMPMVGLAVSSAQVAMTSQDKLNDLGYIFTGYKSGNFDFNRLLMSYGPVVAGMAVHKIAGYAGVNKALGRAKVPFLRI